MQTAVPTVVLELLRPKLVPLAIASGLLLTSCGGGGGEAPEPPSVTLGLGVRTTEAGTVIDCTASRPSDVRLTRASGSTIQSQTIRCPSLSILTGDFTPSLWEALPLPVKTEAGKLVGRVTTATILPAPRLVPDGQRLITIPHRAITALAGSVRLEQVEPGAASVPSSHRALAGDAAVSTSAWRWMAEIDGTVYQSSTVNPTTFRVTDTGFWGAVALAEPDSLGNRFFPPTRQPGFPEGHLLEGREFRDIRYADFNGDGLPDIVSNVYGIGCVMIALSQPDSGFVITTPQDADGACIGGHGETILVADFDGDGDVDVFLPSYERFHLLRNRGNGEFDEVAEQAGIAFPNYLPRVEGAAAVDIDFDGDVDIVVANEVLLNDGQGRFTPMLQPFGAERVFDEGMSVADVDADGRFDIVKHHPVYGPRFYWGRRTGGFDDAGWMFGGEAVSDSANGIAVGDLSGNGLPDLVLPGGRAVEPPPGLNPGATGGGPRLCVQLEARRFECLLQFVEPIDGAWSDLLMVTDVDGDGREELVARYGTLRVYVPTPRDDVHVYRFDLRNQAGRRTEFGQSFEVRCAIDDSVIATKFVDGGNGFMAQGEYIVSVHSEWCTEVRLLSGSAMGRVEIGRFTPGKHTINRTAAIRAAAAGARAS